jgi:hypothetical protein
MADSPGRDFFISYTGVNRSWAEWIGVQLEAAGYSTVLQAWDFRSGSDFLHQMQQATTSASRRPSSGCGCPGLTRARPVAAAGHHAVGADH